MSADRSSRDGLGRWAMSLAFYLYALLGAPPLARALKAGLEQADPRWWPGALLFAILLLEPFGLRWKLQFLRRRNADEGFVPQGPMLAFWSVTTIAHVIVTMMVGMLALDAWGAVGSGADDASGWWGGVMVALILKEFIGLIAAGGRSRARRVPGHWQEHLADLLLLAYGGVAYTAWWEAIMDLEALGAGTLGPRLALLPVLAVLFVFLYLPMRLPFLLEEFHLRPSAGRKWRLTAELGAGMVFGLYPVFG
ncbi:MAG: hypothetical protein KBC66_03045 [Kiritimatiellae bacterium]|nr:hypothetical protein [Kiritimatiellia bacterium]NLD90351.1 hypothetical protein [Lentisphaerota bacterium]HPC19471.1 hypothetical protein [Kiritimatiellia bacterium]HQN80060.1 hypothetical protein [Kiritimatiellia bacterium]